MTGTIAAQDFLNTVRNVVSSCGNQIALSGESARCLWILSTLPEQSLELWTRICRAFPLEISGIVVANTFSPSLTKDLTAIGIEFGETMLRTQITVDLGAAGSVPLAAPSFVLAQILTEADPLAITRVALFLRCLHAAGHDIDIEEVRAILKAVRAGEKFDQLSEVADLV